MPLANNNDGTKKRALDAFHDNSIGPFKLPRPGDKQT